MDSYNSFDTFNLGDQDQEDVFQDFSEEIREIIAEMGYNVEEGELQEIEKDLRLLEENADVVDDQLFSCLLDRFDDGAFPTDPENSIKHLSDLITSPAQPSKSRGIPRELDELITHGYERLQEVYEDIKRYERLLGEDDQAGAKVGEHSKSTDKDPSDDKQTADQNKENKKPSRKEKPADQLDPRQETRLLNQFLRANALRPTSCPAPGRLPFKHDHQLKLAQYRKEWAKLPPPGEQKRMALRWRIRELMLRRDIPHLRLIPVESSSNMESSSQPVMEEPPRRVVHHQQQQTNQQWKP